MLRLCGLPIQAAAFDYIQAFLATARPSTTTRMRETRRKGIIIIIIIIIPTVVKGLATIYTMTIGRGFLLFGDEGGGIRSFHTKLWPRSVLFGPGDVSAVTRRRGSARPNTPRSFSDDLITSSSSTIIDRLVRSGALSMAKCH